MIPITILLLLFLPTVIQFGESRVKLIRWLSPAFFCYVGGIVFGNLISFSVETNQTILNTSVVLAIPLLLCSANMKTWLRLAKPTVISYLLYLLTVVICTSAAAWLFRDLLVEPIHAAAMAGSVYTGGTANMGAIKIVIGASEQLFAEMNLSDLMLSGGYLLIILAGVQRLLLLFLPAFSTRSSETGNFSLEEAVENTEQFWNLSIRERIPKVLLSLLVGVGVVGVCAGLSWGLLGKIDEIPVLVGITLLGLGISLVPRIRNMIGTYETGEYLFLIFCVAVGMMVDINILLEGTTVMLGFMACVLYGSVILHSLLGAIFRLDADTILITNVAGVFGPPFIGPVAKTLNNREILISGLTLSVINLAIGNLFGLMIFWLLGGG